MQTDGFDSGMSDFSSDVSDGYSSSSGSSGSSGSDWSSGSNNYGTGGQENWEIEIIIRPDGTVEETVKGLQGEDCLKVTQEIEKALGTVVKRKATSEMYQQPNYNRQSNTVSQWVGREGEMTDEW
jgi:hypothetical protein